jgi:radical SAM protein with 4Fe4S-binding SPASM domain
MFVLSLPAIYALELTPVCNNRCPGCSNIYARDRSASAPMSAAMWRQLLSPFIGDATQIRLTGGEPTLHPEFAAIFEYVTAGDAWVTVFTNGRWQDPEGFVASVRGRRHFSGLLISLHGSDEASHEAFSGIRGSYAETLANIKLAISRGIPVALSMVITQYSWDKIQAMASLAEELGAQQLAVNRYIGAPLPQIEPLDYQVQSAVRETQALIWAGAPVTFGIGVPQCYVVNASEGCLAGVAYASIDPWGRLRPCAHSPTVVGSLHEHSLRDLWHGAAMEQWRAAMPLECTMCEAYPVCHGGCRAIQELRSDTRDPLRRAPVATFTPLALEPIELPATARPRFVGRLRAESFGYVLLGQGQAMPVRPEARPIIEACAGRLTLLDLQDLYGEDALDLLGELWQIGLIDLV